MSLDIPVFDLKPLKKQFFFFLIAVILLAVTCFLLVYLLDASILLRHYYTQGNNNWYFLGIALLFTIFSDRQQKKHFRAIQEVEDVSTKVSLYSKYYKIKLIWGGVSLLLTGILWVTTGGKFIFYLFLFQLIISVVFYPNKAIITSALQTQDIEFI
jgi:hypothetical protein